MNPQVLMVGWELPPHNSGGLGVACMGLSKALADKGTGITFVLPKRQDIDLDFMNLIFADVEMAEGEMLKAYTTHHSWAKLFDTNDIPPDYVRGALSYAKKMGKLAKLLKGKVNIIHAHDWMTYPAAMAAQEVLKVPMVSHVHATEYDRTGGNWPNPKVFKIEKRGVDVSDKVLPVGGITKNILINKYQTDPGKIEVVYNGVDTVKKELAPALMPLKKMGYKLVLFLGRLTLQKGPEYFVKAAKIVSNYDPKTIFIVTGSGDMQEQMIAETIKYGVFDKFLFTGFLRDEEKDRIFQAADIYVMPSVSEPFGITALEAVVNGTPVLVSKQSGVSEIMHHALKVDFWDINDMADKILAVLSYKALPKDLITESFKEVKNYTWEKSAEKVLNVYRELI